MIFQRYRPFFILINNIWKICSFTSFPPLVITKNFHLSHPNMYTVISQDGIISFLAKVLATFYMLPCSLNILLDDGSVQEFCLACFLHCLLSYCQVFKVLCINQTQITFIYEILKMFFPIFNLFCCSLISFSQSQNFKISWNLFYLYLYGVFWYHI